MPCTSGSGTSPPITVRADVRTWPIRTATGRRLIEHLEKSDLIVVRTDFGGRRSFGVPGLGLTTAVA